MNERMGMYEIFAESRLSYEEVISAMIESTNIPAEKIGSDYDFYDPLVKDTNLVLGVKVGYFEEGYLSFISLASMPEMQAREYYRMCSQLAFNLNVNVAVYNLAGDFGDMIVFRPNGFYQEATEDSHSDNGLFIRIHGDDKLLNTLV
jgi:hypothetical protein